MGGQHRAVEGVAARIALEELGVLLGRAVLLLDDAVHAAVGVEFDAAVAKGHGRGEGEDRAGMRAAGDRLGEGADGLGLDKGQVAVQHYDGPGVDAGRLKCGAHGMAGAQALGLLDALDGARVRRALVSVGDEPADLVGMAAHHHDHAVAPRLERGVDHPACHGFSQNLVRHLGMIGLHARAFTGGHYNRGNIHTRLPKIGCRFLRARRADRSMIPQRGRARRMRRAMRVQLP